MSTQVQFRRGSTSQTASFTGAAGEVTVDTSKNTCVVHDGSTAGGFPLLRQDGVNSALSSGSLSSPALKFANSLSTGIYSPTAGTIAFANGGVLGLSVDASGFVTVPNNATVTGNLGIGSSSYSTKFYAYGTQVTEPALTATVGPILGLNSTNNADTTGVQTVLSIARAGKTSVSYGNQVNFNLGRYSQSGYTANTQLTFRLTNGLTNNPDVDVLTLLSSGNVGIGTTTPATILEASSPTGTRIRASHTNNSGGRDAGFEIYGDISGAFASRSSWTYAGNSGLTSLTAALDLAFSTSSTERLRIDSSGRVLVGTTIARTNIFNASYTPLLQVETSVNDTTRTQVFGYNNNSIYGPGLTFVKSRGTTNGSSTIVQNGDELGLLAFTGLDGAKELSGAYILGNVDGTPGLNSMPGRIGFFTTPSGAATSTERMRIDSSGRVGIGLTNPTAGLAVQAYGTQLIADSQTYYQPAGRAHMLWGQGGNVDLWAGFVGGYNASTGSCNIILQPTFLNVSSQSGAYIGGEVTSVSNTALTFGHLLAASTVGGNATKLERMRIDSTGLLQVGTVVAPSVSGYAHEVRWQGASRFTLRNVDATAANCYGLLIDYTNGAPNSAGNEFLYCQDNAAGGTQRAVIRGNGGLANFQANNVNLSDINTKKDITPAAGTWDCLKEWEIVNYRYKDQPDDTDLNLGVIAQQIANSCPEVITVFQEAKEAKEAVLDENGNETEPAREAQPERLGIKEQQMYWMAIKALQEAQLRIESLESKVAALEAR
jgi:hypothetical protein